MLEQLKILLVRGLPSSPLGDDVELRLTEVRDGVLELTWLKASDERPISRLEVPRETYDEVATDADGFQELRTELTAGPFVDFHRLLVPIAP